MQRLGEPQTSTSKVFLKDVDGFARATFSLPSRWPSKATPKSVKHLSRNRIGPLTRFWFQNDVNWNHNGANIDPQTALKACKVALARRSRSKKLRIFHNIPLDAAPPTKKDLPRTLFSEPFGSLCKHSEPQSSKPHSSEMLGTASSKLHNWKPQSSVR